MLLGQNIGPGFQCLHLISSTKRPLGRSAREGQRYWREQTQNRHIIIKCKERTSMNEVLGKYSCGVICTYAPGVSKPADMFSAACIVYMHHFQLYSTMYGLCKSGLTSTRKCPLGSYLSGWTYNDEMGFEVPLESFNDGPLQTTINCLREGSMSRALILCC